VRYAIIGGNTQGQFSIDSQSGEVSLVKSLDYEAMRSYRLMIRAQGIHLIYEIKSKFIMINILFL